jgi:hypothetical protein
MKYPDLIFDTHRRKDCPNRYCRVHNYYDFESKWHLPFPNTWNYHSNTHGWVNATVHCGPLAWEPKRPMPSHWSQMALVCPHEQLDLTCNFCLRHTFHPYEI